MAAKNLTAERLRELLTYDPATGVFKWKTGGKGRRPDLVAGGLHPVLGYWYIGVDRVKYPLHRVAWLYMTGEWPKEEIDHINGVRSDNRWSNLREATKGQNMQNLRKQRGRTSRYMGVSWHQCGRWVSYITVDGKRRHLGLFDDEEVAYEAHLQAKRKLHEFCTI